MLDGEMGVIRWRGWLSAIAGTFLLAGAAAVAGQRLFLGVEPPIHNAPYDGRFAFVRIKYATAPGGLGYCGLPAWAHGYQSCRGGARARTSESSSSCLFRPECPPR